MFETYLFSDEWNQEEKDNLIKKTAYYMERMDLPEQIIKPHALIYGEDGKCMGYSYYKPPCELISLKKLFQTEFMNQYQIGVRQLFDIAGNGLKLLEKLNSMDIFPGFIDLSFLYVPVENPGKTIYLFHPEMFQAGNLPSSYPWYPSDGRLYQDEFELFDREKQGRADGKLIYKILTASSKGNAKVPPNGKNQETSFFYWNLLSREWKDYFLSLAEKNVSYEQLENMIQKFYEKESAKTASLERANGLEKKEQKQPAKKKAYALITILRQAEKSIQDVSRELYLLQEKLESHPDLSFDQGFVLGNRHVFKKEFRHYEKEYRSQLGHVILDYSYGEALIMAVEMMEAALKREERPSFLFILLDGEIKNDKIFHIALKRLEKLKENWYTKLVLVPTGQWKGEGYQLLKNICMKGNKK